jgi:hypothetical protein
MNPDVLTNLYSSLLPWWKTINLWTILIGFILVGIGVLQLIFAQSRSTSMFAQVSPITGWVAITIGSFMVNIMGMLDIMTVTFFEQSALQTLDYVDTYEDSGQLMFDAAMRLAFLAVALVGFVGFVSGWYMLYSNSHRNGQHGMGKPITHIIGGAFAINLDLLIETLGETAGGAVQSLTNLLV